MLARPKVSTGLTHSTTSQWLDGMLTSRSRPRFAAIELHDHYRLGATPSIGPRANSADLVSHAGSLVILADPEAEINPTEVPAFE